jgi:mono/diheme cytochrome c family protein
MSFANCSRAAIALGIVLVGAIATSGDISVQSANAQATKAAKAPRVTSSTRVPAQTDGEYLARAGDCIACHTARGGEPFAGGSR